jgi:uncharacterized membrane protein YagU involved in acid resistance
MNILIRILFGILGGIVATGPMTVAMILLHEKLPGHKRHPLPPKEITDKAIRKVGLGHKLSREAKAGLTLLNHFAYGGATGAIYAIATHNLKGCSMIKGPIFGLLVWGLSYLGLLPALNVLKSATRHSLERNALMIAVHLVWGVVLSVFVDLMQRESERGEGALLGSSPWPHRDVS